MPNDRYTPEMAVDLRVPSHLRVSPDGRGVAFCVAPIGHREKDPTSVLFVADSDGRTPPRALTGSEHSHLAPRWSPDGRALALLSDRPKRGEAQLHVVPATGGELLRLTSLDGGVEGPEWTPDGRAIAFTARRTALAGEKEPERDIKVASERWKPKAIAAVPATGGAPRVVGPAAGHVWSFAWSPDGLRVAALVAESEDLVAAFGGVRLVVMDADGGNERALLDLSGFPNTPQWSEDSRLIALIGVELPKHHHSRVLVVDVESGEVTRFDDRGMTPTWVAFAGDDLLVHAVETQRTRIDRTDPRGAEWERLELGEDAAERWIDSGVNIHAAGVTLAFNAARFDRGPDVHVARLGEPAVRLTDLNPQLASVRLATMEDLTWTASDGSQVHGWLMLPPGAESGERLPLVAAIHGGPSWQWGNWFHGTWHDWGQLLAAEGYAVFMPNPRGSTGRGGDYTSANRHDFGGGDFDDIMTGIDMLIARGVADPDRLGICGWSFGGFMTAWAVTQTDRFKAAVAGAAPTNWVSKIGTTDIRPYNEWDIGQVNEEPDQVWERSPIRYVKHVTTPTLVVQGEADQRVPAGQAWEFHNALRALGVPTDLALYPRQGHAFTERAHQLDLLQRLTGWFATYLRDVRQIR